MSIIWREHRSNPEEPPVFWRFSVFWLLVLNIVIWVVFSMLVNVVPFKRIYWLTAHRETFHRALFATTFVIALALPLIWRWRLRHYPDRVPRWRGSDMKFWGLLAFIVALISLLITNWLDTSDENFDTHVDGLRQGDHVYYLAKYHRDDVSGRNRGFAGLYRCDHYGLMCDRVCEVDPPLETRDITPKHSHNCFRHEKNSAKRVRKGHGVVDIGWFSISGSAQSA